MKKYISVICILALAIFAGSCGKNSVPEAAQMPAQIEQSVPVLPAESVSEVPVTPAPVPEEVPADPQAAAQEAVPEAVPEAVLPQEGCTVEGGGYTVEIQSASLTVDGNGNNAIAVRFLFTNNNNDPANFMWIADDHVSQNGSPLSVDGMTPNMEDPTQFNFTVQISNGQSIPVTYIYPCYSTDPVDISFNILRDFNSRTVLGSGSCTLTLQ